MILRKFSFPWLDMVRSILPRPSILVENLDIDWSKGDFFHKAITPNSTFTFSNLEDGVCIRISVRNDGVDDVTVAFPSGIYKSGDLPSTLPASKTAVYAFYYINGKVYATFISPESTPIPDWTPASRVILVSHSQGKIEHSNIVTEVNASNFGNVITARLNNDSVIGGNSSKALIVGGSAGATRNRIDAISFASQSNATVFGNLANYADYGINGESYKYSPAGNHFYLVKTSCASNPITMLIRFCNQSNYYLVHALKLATFSNSYDYGNLLASRAGGCAVSNPTKALFYGMHLINTSLDVGYSSNDIESFLFATRASASLFSSISRANHTPHAVVANNTTAFFSNNGTDSELTTGTIKMNTTTYTGYTNFASLTWGISTNVSGTSNKVKGVVAVGSGSWAQALNLTTETSSVTQSFMLGHARGDALMISDSHGGL